MVQQQYPVQRCNEVAVNTFLLQCLSPGIASIAQPGQFVNVLASESGEGPLLRRPFSISRIEGESIEFLFHVVGSGTSLLSKKQPGDLIDMIGPLGQSFRIDAEYQTALIVAGGIGVAPFPFLTSELLKKNKRVETFLGFRSARQVVSSYLQNIHIATDDGSEGFHGNVVQLLESFLDRMDMSKTKIFACGPTVMMKALTHAAKMKSICCEISLEGQMACGVGLCQGCPVERVGEGSKYALICKDGPTFLASEVNL